MPKKRRILRYSFLIVLLVAFFYIIFNNYIFADVISTPGIEENTLIQSQKCYSMSGYTINSTLENSTTPTTCISKKEYLKVAEGRSGVMKISGNIEEESDILFSLDSTVSIEDGTVARLEPNTKYRLSFDTRIKNRTCKNVKPLMDVGKYPKELPGAKVNESYYNWCGAYDLSLKDIDYDPNKYTTVGANLGTTDKSKKTWSRITNNLATDGNLVAYSEQAWTNNNYEFTTLDNGNVQLRMRIFGLEGEFYIDNIRFDKVDSFVSDSEMETPIKNTPFKMIKSNESEIVTNAATYKISDNSISSYNNDNPSKALSWLTFDKSKNILAGLKKVKEIEGVTILENSNIRIAFGADSTAIIKLKKNTSLEVNGDKKAYSFYRNGLIFTRDNNDYNGKNGDGFMFTPVSSRGDMDKVAPLVGYGKDKDNLTWVNIEKSGLVYTNSKIFNPKDNNKVIADVASANTQATPKVFENEDVQIAKLQKWTDDLSVNASSNSWNISYNGGAGDAYILSVFPQKSFDKKGFCKTIVNHSATGIKSGESGWFENMLARLNVLSNFVNVWHLWNYAYTVPETRFSPDNLKSGFDRLFDIQRPEKLNNSNEWISNSSEINKLFSAKTIAYSSPEFSLTSDAKYFADHITNQNSKNLNIGGIYYDGYLDNDWVENLNLVRLTKSTLGDKIYVQHSSGNTPFFNNRASDNYKGILKSSTGAKFRPAFLDAYADYIWTGEGIPFSEDNYFKNNYSGYGLSNTPVALLTLAREGKSIYEQISSQINNWGQIRPALSSYNFYESKYKDNVTGTYTTYNTSSYYKQLADRCLSQTCGDGVCDILENYSSCSSDCAKQSKTENVLTNSIVQAKESLPLANWLIDKNELFNFHMNFNYPIPHDLSSSKLDANITNIPDKNCRYNCDRLPVLDKSDNRISYKFDGVSSIISGYHGSRIDQEINGNKPKLDLTGSDFTIIASIKTDSPAKSQTVFALGKDVITNDDISENVALKIVDSKPVFQYVSNSKINSCNIDTNIDNKWHQISISYSDKKIKFYMDNILKTTCDAENLLFDDNMYRIGMSKTASGYEDGFKGLIDEIALSKTALSDSTIANFWDQKTNITNFKNLYVKSYSQQTFSAVYEMGFKLYSLASKTSVITSNPSPIATVSTTQTATITPTITTSPKNQTTPTKEKVKFEKGTSVFVLKQNQTINNFTVFKKNSLDVMYYAPNGWRSAIKDNMPLRSDIGYYVTNKKGAKNIEITIEPVVDTQQGIILKKGWNFVANSGDGNAFLKNEHFGTYKDATPRTLESLSKSQEIYSKVTLDAKTGMLTRRKSVDIVNNKISARTAFWVYVY